MLEAAGFWQIGVGQLAGELTVGLAGLAEPPVVVFRPMVASVVLLLVATVFLSGVPVFLSEPPEFLSGLVGVSLWLRVLLPDEFAGDDPTVDLGAEPDVELRVDPVA
ncbi:hypothetical protein ACQ86N_35740 [Puia sp. P3]|uniref:hypothetical protein n=1 Tax=Puia sp. P3 TaxID=3423952 RepID=UPI003D6771F6